MENVNIVLSGRSLTLILVCFTYAPVCIFCYRQLMPRLAPTAKHLASIILAAQVFVIAAAAAIPLSLQFFNMLWALGGYTWNAGEWNIPATLASTQLALVAGVSLLAAMSSPTRLDWQRLYLLGISLIFFYLALDEYLTLHEYIPNWGTYFTILGALIVLATLALAARLARAEWKWHACFLIGLAISAAGAIILDVLPAPCSSLGIMRFDGCLDTTILEESLEFLGIWLVLLGLLGHYSGIAPIADQRARRALMLLPALWISLLLVYSLIPRLEVRWLTERASVHVDSGVTVHGYRIDSGADYLALPIYASARQADYLGLGYSIHLIDQVTGESVASLDEWAGRQHGFWLFGPDYAPVFRQWMRMNIPPAAPPNRAHWIVLSLWRDGDGDFIRQTVLSSDLNQLSDTQVVLGELTIPAPPDASPADPLAHFDNGFTLDTVSLPESARPGEILNIQFTWRSDSSRQRRPHPVLAPGSRRDRRVVGLRSAATRRAPAQPSVVQWTRR